MFARFQRTPQERLYLGYSKVQTLPEDETGEAMFDSGKEKEVGWMDFVLSDMR